MYGIMVALGVLAAFGVLYLYGKKMKIDLAFTDFLFYDGIVSVFLGFGFAAVFQGLYNYIENPADGFSLKGGITFLGGMLGGAAVFIGAYFLFRRRLKGRLVSTAYGFPALSVLPCCVLIGHSLGRVGCFFAGCCYGKQTDSWLGVKFPNLSEPVYPTQLYEAAFLLILFAVCSYLLLKKNFRHNMTVYLIGYGIFRFLIEFIRGDDRGKFFGILSPSQFWALGMVMLGVVLYFCMERIWRREPAPAETDNNPENLTETDHVPESGVPADTAEESEDTNTEGDTRNA